MPAPSPSTRPERSRENGRQVSALSTRSASQHLNTPTTMEASAPPVSTTSDRPSRMASAAQAMAWLAEAQADATA